MPDQILSNSNDESSMTVLDFAAIRKFFLNFRWKSMQFHIHSLLLLSLDTTKESLASSFSLSSLI